MEWQEILLIVVTVLLLISGGFIKKLWSALKGFVDVVDAALVDGNITPEEWKGIRDAGGNILKIITSIVQLVALKKRG